MGGSFKSGAGTLDFEESDDAGDATESDDETESPSESESTADQESADATGKAVAGSQQEDAVPSSTESPSNTYPYFVRRSSVGDERSNRMEVHVRDDVANQESEYLTELADELDTDSVAKTDAREFALKLAHEQPEEVARLMREEGYGELG